MLARGEVLIRCLYYRIKKDCVLVVSIPESYTGGLSKKDEVTFSVKALPNQKFTAQVNV